MPAHAIRELAVALRQDAEGDGASTVTSLPRAQATAWRCASTTCSLSRRAWEESCCVEQTSSSSLI